MIRMGPKEDRMNNNNSRFPTKINLIVRAVVGGYLLYLSYGLYHDRGVGDIQPLPLALIIAAFTIIGVGLIVPLLIVVIFAYRKETQMRGIKYEDLRGELGREITHNL